MKTFISFMLTMLGIILLGPVYTHWGIFEAVGGLLILGGWAIAEGRT